MALKRSASYVVEADREGLRLSVDETFWPDTTDEEGRSQLDFHIAQVLAEVRAALYIVATCATTKH